MYHDELPTELIDGELVEMALRATNHAFVSGNIRLIFFNYLYEKMDEPFGFGLTVYLTEDNHFVPDFMVVCDPSKVQDDGIHGAPDLVVEVLSPGSVRYDRGKKKDVYEACGVREYWLVSPTEKFLEQYLLQDGHFVLNNIYSVHPDWMLKRMTPEARAAVVTEFKCSLYDDLTITLEDVFARVP